MAEKYLKHTASILIIVSVIGLGVHAGAAPEEGKTKVTFADIAAVNKQAAASMPACRIRFRITYKNFQPYKDYLLGRQALLAEEWKTLSADEKKERELEFEVVDREVTFRQSWADVEPMDGMIEWSRDGVVIQWPPVKLTIDKDRDPTPAEPSFTGGQYWLGRFDRRAPDPKWVVLNPYPQEDSSTRLQSPYSPHVA